MIKVEILPGCTSCGLCESINSDVFRVNDTAHVNEKNIRGNEKDCITAAAQCPVGVIKISE